MTVPNAAVAFDLSASVYNHDVIQLGMKYNWNTWHQYAPYYVFNVLDIRPEYRRYYRQTQRAWVPVMVPDTTGVPEGGIPVMVPKWIETVNPVTGRTEKVQEMGWAKADFFSTARKNPKPGRAYYWGAYADYTTYSLKPGRRGRQGWAVGIGLSAGYEIPLYEYRRGAIDLDLGLSAGLLVTANKAYALSDADPYAYAREPAKDIHFLPLPMLTELRAVFSYRTKSVRAKYNKLDPSDKYFQDEKSTIDNDLSGSTKAAFDANISKMDRIRFAQSDSLYRAAYLSMLDQTSRERLSRLDTRLSERQREKLSKYMEKGCASLIKEFDAELNAAKKEKEDEARKAAVEKKKAIDAAARQARKQEKKNTRTEEQEDPE